MENTNIKSFETLVKPNMLKSIHPITEEIKALVISTRKSVSDIIKGNSSKKIFVVGPCSIHNVDEALKYAKQLKQLADEVKDKILIIMRVYFEKPRTTVGWKGLINDPDLNNSFNVNKGLGLARKLLLDINGLGLPCGYEVLDTITPQYISDLISWGAVGARTTESQVHRQMVSGLSMPVGFKNGTSGNICIARDAILSAAHEHCFMGITDKGNPAICKTKGNKNCHIILRGGTEPNFEENYIIESELLLKEKSCFPAIMVDCSHGNSRKDYKNQHDVLKKTLENMKRHPSLIGVMIESNLFEGKQKHSLASGNFELKPGISITDSCIGFVETKQIITNAHNFILNYSIKP